MQGIEPFPRSPRLLPEANHEIVVGALKTFMDNV